MPLVTIVCGVLLVVVGVLGYTVSDAENPVTALIPAGWGVLLIVPGIIAQGKPGIRKHLVHLAVLLGLIGLLLAGGRLAMVLADDKPDSMLGLTSLAAMASICGVFVVICVKSFVDARRNRS
ncbi:MAG: hypothetical protein WBC44_07670 [Planctomycetaceae bacterium]